MKLIPLGGDVDTVCAVYGQLAGACYGMEEVEAAGVRSGPEEEAYTGWLKDLQKQELLDSVFLPIAFPNLTTTGHTWEEWRTLET